ncbi:E3 ubiquitin-protein ligase Mdm2-like [Hydractinia symbiolongicarpus]|uniref:E3 ubiquitin-protein ligase Mdm2-like n=1 Tax=Hydractinia symbiolongicarpus TaxID=13093 RepID=UPI00254DBD45|nr:E3 ubiquitin-protein ligase Mdm2-like [Hydractinia symbiolongicarpus]
MSPSMTSRFITSICNVHPDTCVLIRNQDIEWHINHELTVTELRDIAGDLRSNRDYQDLGRNELFTLVTDLLPLVTTGAIATERVIELINPEPIPALVENDNSDDDDLDESEKCIICLSKRRTATIVHGRTGHCCCCLSCAYILEKRKDKCPICRAPIDLVIRQYMS